MVPLAVGVSVRGRRDPSCVGEGQYGENPAVVLGRGGQLELGEDAGHVLLHRPACDHERFGDCLVAASLGHQFQDVVLAGRQVLEVRLRAGSVRAGRVRWWTGLRTR